MYMAYEAEVQQFYGMELYGVTWENFGTLVKNVFDDRFVCLD